MVDVRKELAELRTVQVVVMCFLVIMLEGFDIQAAGVTMRKLATEFQLDKLQMGYFASSSAVGVLLFAAIGGILADQFGRKPVVIAATALFGLACLVTPWSSGFGSLLAARFLTGAGLGAAMPVVIAMTSDHSPASQKKRYVGIVYCAISLGGMLCAAIMATGWLGSDWRPIYYIGGVLPIAIALAMFGLFAGVAAEVGGSNRRGGRRRQLVRHPRREQAANHPDPVARHLPYPRRDVSVRIVDADFVAAARLLADRRA